MVGFLFVFGLSPRVYGQRGRREQRGPYDNARSLVGQVQSDLQRASRYGRPSGKEQERYDNALRHLSEFDRDLSQSKFNKDKLDTAIDDLNNVVKNNTISPRERDRLNGDLQQLRSLRANRGLSY